MEVYIRCGKGENLLSFFRVGETHSRVVKKKSICFLVKSAVVILF